jgi:hypothetical protein
MSQAGKRERNRVCDRKRRYYPDDRYEALFIRSAKCQWQDQEQQKRKVIKTCSDVTHTFGHETAKPRKSILPVNDYLDRVRANLEWSSTL